MNLNKKNTKYIIISIFSVYLVLLILLSKVYVILDPWEISVILLLGFIIVTLVLFIFTNINHKKGNYLLFRFNFLSENSIKILLIVLLIIAVLIPPILNKKSIILWEEIYFLNYFRAVISLFGCMYLPGATLYSIFFPQGKLSKYIHIEPFILKITLYPLLSLGYLGISILIFDQFNLVYGQIGISLFISILILFLLDMILQKKRFSSIGLKKININVSRYSFIILLLAIGISTISIGYQFGWKYLVSGDPWQTIKFANQIGVMGSSPIYIWSYPNFWGYISFGLSLFSGIPYININTLLAPFCYLFITSIYILNRSILINFKEKYSVLSTLFISIFTGFYIDNPIFSLITGSEFYFTHKSFSFLLLFSGLALFLISINRKNREGYDIKRFWYLNLRYITLASFFLILSFMSYMFPLLLGIIFIFLYCIFTEKTKILVKFKFFINFIFITLIIYICFDILLQFYLSHIIIHRFLIFYQFERLIMIIEVVPPPIIIYSLLFSFTLIIYCLKFLISKIVTNNGNLAIKWNKKLKFIPLIVLLIFALSSIVEILVNVLEIFIFRDDISKSNIFFFCLDYFFLNIGFIGLIGLLFSYYCFKKDKKLFFTLISWILLSFLLAFLLIFIEIIANFPLSPENLPRRDLHLMNYWFKRIWIYSIPALCVLASIGLIELLNNFKNYRIIANHKSLLPITKNLISLSLILFSFSGIINTGILFGNTHFRYSKPAITTLNWISENIPIHSGVLVGDNFFMGVGVDSITFVEQYFFYNIFKEDFNEIQCIEQIEYLKNNNIQYALISQFFISYYLNKSDFTNNILLPKFYNITLFDHEGLSVHYAPYFD